MAGLRRPPRRSGPSGSTRRTDVAVSKQRQHMTSSVPVIVICSVNRPELLHESVLSLLEQTIPCRILITVPGEKHVSPKTRALPGVEIILSAAPGSCAQRNAALRHVDPACAVIFFFDDDVEVEEHYVEEMLRAFEQHPSIMVASGVNLGLGSPPGTLTRAAARDLIRFRPSAHCAMPCTVPARAARGCMMCFRASLLGKAHFDERLPLYGYLEDLDFTLQCSGYGEIAIIPNCLMVHIETAQGRMGSRRRGYSEVVNPLYILSKGTGGEVARLFGGAVKRSVKNLLRCHTRDGRKQFSGNLLGWARVAAGKIEPEYVLQIKDLA